MKWALFVKFFSRGLWARVVSVLLVCSMVSVSFGSVANARYISPDTMDPTLPGVGTNRYAYSDNDPINKRDQNGHIWGFVISGIAAYFASAVEANAPAEPSEVRQTTDAQALGNMAAAAAVTPVGRLAGTAINQSLANNYKNLSFAQTTYRETFDAFGRDKYSEIAGTRIRTINDLSDAIKSGRVNPKQISVDVGTINGQGYIANTRTATALERAGIPRSQWNINNINDDEAAMGRLRNQLSDPRNKITPGLSISPPRSESGGESIAGGSSSSSGGGLLGAIGKATGLW